MTTLVGCVDTEAGKAGIIVTAEDAMDLIHNGYSHKEDICFYVHRDSIHDEKNKAAFSVSRFKMEHKTHLFNELKVLRSRGTSFLKLDREDKEGVMRHVIAVWKDGEEPDTVCNLIGIVSICGFDSVTKSCYISRVQPGSIYWFHSEENRNRVHDWVTKKPKSAEEPKSLTAKQMNMMYWIVETTLRGEDVIERVGRARYDKYYPLYVLLKKLKQSKIFMKWLQKSRKSAEE